ncbi:DUF2878 domain-containing protein [Silanimonas lenta]|uniref:DUF2878 domain-containing protein n=1 Tax=Silanimonas lenta TaxID=265429 RepID=UPI000406CBD7|nr:DUF2878 domain-containing protein [Silanimonas lenta]
MALGFRIANLLGFQAVWFASVFGAGSGRPWLGPLVASVFVAAHLAASPDRRGDLRLLALALALGAVVDSLFAASGLLRYAGAWPSDALAPGWILAMWAGFALTLHHSMAFLRGRPAAAAAFGLVGGPLAYWAAQRGFGAVAFEAGTAPALALVGLGWALALPLLYATGARTPPPRTREATA